MDRHRGDLNSEFQSTVWNCTLSPKNTHALVLFSASEWEAMTAAKILAEILSAKATSVIKRGISKSELSIIFILNTLIIIPAVRVIRAPFGTRN